jgi:hypothetical protein
MSVTDSDAKLLICASKGGATTQIIARGRKYPTKSAVYKINKPQGYNLPNYH